MGDGMALLSFNWEYQVWFSPLQRRSVPNTHHPDCTLSHMSVALKTSMFSLSHLIRHTSSLRLWPLNLDLRVGMPLLLVSICLHTVYTRTHSFYLPSLSFSLFLVFLLLLRFTSAQSIARRLAADLRRLGVKIHHSLDGTAVPSATYDTVRWPWSMSHFNCLACTCCAHSSLSASASSLFVSLPA